jgi:hypothetical protein
MKAELLSNTIASYYGLDIPLVIVGPPGGGKTSIVKQTARRMRKPCITVHLPTALVEDFGVPDIVSAAIQAENDEYEDNSFGYRLPAWWPAEGGPLDNGRGGFLVFDDRNQADQSLQKVLANILQDRTLHGVKLAKGWYPISTGNRQEDRAGANRILGHLANREVELELESDLDASCRWMMDNGGAPEVISFLRHRPGLLHAYEAQAHKSPTPRGWHEHISPVIGNIAKEAEYECFKGSIGDGAAAEFTGYMRIWRDLEDPDLVIANPRNAKVPTDSATLYALCGALSMRATEDNFANVITYAERLPGDFMMLMISLSVRTNPDVAETAAYIHWLGKADTHALLF